MIPTDLKKAHDEGRLLLFVGAGVSINLGLPSWRKLIDEIARQLGYDADVFSTYGGGNHLPLAEYYRRIKGSLGPLRSWMDVQWHSPHIDVTGSDIHSHIVDGNFPLIYTTNYDRWLERAHDQREKAFVKVANVAHLVDAVGAQRQIVKFHGDFDDDSSIVLDETSYFNRLTFESPLDIKLRADVLGRSVLFIGYSLTDINMRLLFHKLTATWRENLQPHLRPKSYLFSHMPNPVDEEVLRHWGITRLSSEDDNPKGALTAFLKELIS
jgi:hypothetical protein